MRHSFVTKTRFVLPILVALATSASSLGCGAEPMDSATEDDPSSTPESLLVCPGPGCCLGQWPTMWAMGGGGVTTGTSGDDVIQGTSGNDTINGAGGNDIICGMGGNDTIHGDDGNDTINGGA